MQQADRRKILTTAIIAAVASVMATAVWLFFLRPTRILVVNATLAQQAD